MYRPRPHGLHVIGGELSREDEAASELLMRRLTNLKEISGLPSMKLVRALPGGGVAIAQDMGGVPRLIVFTSQSRTEPEKSDGLAHFDVPMLFSGRVLSGVVPVDTGVSMEFTRDCQRRLAHYGELDGVPSMATLRRFLIEYGPVGQEFLPHVSGTFFTYTQYAALRPTWYSGAMAEVMQIVGGYGRQDFEELPDTPLERARMAFPEKTRQKIEKLLLNVRLPGYSGVPPRKGQFQYDYKVNLTHGVGFDDEGGPWLLSVSRDGVFAMPLPMIPATTTAPFREYVEEQGDDEILAILDRFGGLPSGEPFHGGEAFEAWQRAGVIIEICDTSDFYDHFPYSTACGWSFNSRGDEGFNTCHDFSVSGLGYGLAYKLRLQLVPASFDGKLSPTLDLADKGQAARLSRYLAGLYQRTSGGSPVDLAIRYKIRRTEVGELLSRAGGDPDGTNVDFWNNLTMEPIAAHSGRISVTGRGDLYSNARFLYQPQIKFPEPLLGGCVSHDFSPLKGAHNPRCDTIMFGYYVGDELKVVKYFRDPRALKATVRDNFDDCMIVGSWEREEFSEAGIAGNFYTTDFDERKELAPSVSNTKIVGVDRGYDSPPRFAYAEPLARNGVLYRLRYFSTETRTQETHGQSLSVGVCVPWFNRNAVLHARKSGSEWGSKSRSSEINGIEDPTLYAYWTYDFVFAWRGGLSKMTGRPYPVNGNPVWVEEEYYAPGGCSDFADQGPWIGGLPADYTWLIHPNANDWQMSGGGSTPSFSPIGESSSEPGSSSMELRISLLSSAALVNDRPVEWFFSGSPNEIGSVFYADACRVVFGESDYANVLDNLAAEGPRKYWGFSRLADHTGAHHFVGVINE
jgi:hypothetical protein